MRRIRAFSLIEVLVVVSIIALLVGITMPSFREARRVSRKTVCMKNLATIGLGMHAYLLTNRDTFPWVCKSPSYEPTLAADEGRAEYIPLPKALQTEMKGKSEVYLCPADKNTLLKYAVNSERYYDSEGLSYEWYTTKLNGVHLSFGNLPFPIIESLPQTKYRMLTEFERFHGGTSIPRSQNYLYVDLHVQSE